MSNEIDELKLTAYALGELDGPESAAEWVELEAHLVADEAARRHVEEVRATARLVSAELSAELSMLSAGPTGGLTALQHAAIERRLERAARGGALEAGSFPIRPVRHNWAMWGSLAASVVIVCSVMAGVLPKIYHPANPSGPSRNGQNPVAPGDGNPTPGPGPIVIDPGPPPAGPHDGDGQGQQGGLAQSPGLYATPEVPALPDAAPPLVNGERGFIRVLDYPLSTVPTSSAWPDDADRGSLPAIRRGLANGQLPAADLVRTDEVVNAFPYHYPAPAAGEPVSASIEVAACPWNPSHRLMRLGLRTAEVAQANVHPGPTTKPAAKPAAGGLAGLSVQVEFNPGAAGAYRLLGYESGSFGSGARYEARYETEDPRATGHGEKNAGVVGAGRTITALYEIVPASEVVDAGPAVAAPALKYQKLTPVAPSGDGAEARRELVTVSVRFREADAAPRVREFPVQDDGRSFADASEDFQAAAAAAAFAMVLRNSPYKGTATYDQVIEAASRGAEAEPGGARAVLLDLARKAKALGNGG